jgi:hypothetical protein
MKITGVSLNIFRIICQYYVGKKNNGIGSIELGKLTVLDERILLLPLAVHP